MQKLTIYLVADKDTSKIEGLYRDKVQFIVERTSSKPSWVDYKGTWRLPMWGWTDYFTKKVFDKYGKNVDGVMFLLSNWENGKRRINGIQTSRTSNTYDLMFVKGRDKDEEHTAFHEIKHLVDNLVRAHTGFSIDDLPNIKDWDEDVVHKEGRKYDFEYRLDEAWGLIDEAIRIRRMYETLTLIGKLLESIKLFIYTFNVAKRDLVTGEGGEIVKPKEPIEAEKSLYRVALMFLGTDASPNDLAPDELGCAESVSEIIRALINFPTITGTWTLWDKLAKDTRFVEVGYPDEGDVIISPTGTGNGSLVGHTGIVGKNNEILSNNSYTGKFEVTHNVDGWIQHYMGKGGFPVYYYRLK